MKTLLFAGLVLLNGSPGTACAEPPFRTFVAPDGQRIDYVEVRDEPRHRHEFENDRVRLYDVLIAPGDVSLYHRHSENTVYVVVHGGRFRIQLAGEPATESVLAGGTAFFDPQASAPIIHQASNLGADAARLVGMEIYASGRTIARRPIEAHALRLEFDDPRLRIYRVALKPAESSGPFGAGFPGVLVALNEATLSFPSAGGTGAPEVQAVAPASWRWTAGEAAQSISNVGPTPFEAVFYELP